MAGNALEALQAGLARRGTEYPGMRGVDEYLRGEQDMPFIPKKAERELKQLVARSVENWLPLVVRALYQPLKVEGYRRPESPDDVETWRYFKLNNMESRQAQVHRQAMAYGHSFVYVLPGDLGPVIRPLSPLRTTALYTEPEAEFPESVTRLLGPSLTADGKNAVAYQVWDEVSITKILIPEGRDDDPRAWVVEGSESHGMGVVPVVRFMNQWPDDPDVKIHELGEIHALTPIQDRLNETIMGLIVAQNYSAFRQRWMSGVDVPLGKDGKPLVDFKAGADRTWMTPSKDVKFGEFEQTNLDGFLKAREAAVHGMAAIAQIPPHYLMSSITNVSAEALTTSESGLARKLGERQLMFGDSWAQTMRLAAMADGQTQAAEDTDAVIVWADAERRSLAATVDAFGKMVQMLGVPAEMLWSKLPGWTPHDVELAKKLAEELKAEQAEDAAYDVAASMLSGQNNMVDSGKDIKE